MLRTTAALLTRRLVSIRAENEHALGTDLRSLPLLSLSAILENGFATRSFERVASGQQETILLRQAVNGDQSAFAALYELHVDRVFRHVRYQVQSDPDAEDITQEVFVKAWKSLKKYKPTGAPFVSWLIVIARNCIADHFRSKKSVRDLDEISEPVGGPDPATTLEASF